MTTSLSLLQDDTAIDAVAASDLSTLFSSTVELSNAVTQVCEAQLPATEASFTDKAESTTAVEDERSTRFQERFIALVKRYWGSLPSSSTGETVTDSYTGLEAAEDLVDVIWTLDQAFENKTAASGNAEATKKASNRLATLVKGLNASGIIPTDLLKQRLDLPLLQSAGILSSQTSATWTRSEARVKTSLLYKQQKYNLLREESEGYSKLEVELISSMGNPHNNRTAQPAEPISSVRKRAETTLNNIKGLIGYFDLDPARALDVILDVFTDNILYHHVFFRELLQLSPWAPRRRKPDETNGTHSGLPDGGFQPIQEGANTVCAQILGFRFAWYTTSEGSAETPSEKLYLLAAILIWEGLVDLPSLWPHLTPRSDEDFSKLKDTYKDEISDRIAAARSNALSMAGVLMDEEVPPPASKGMSTLTIAGSASLGTPAAGSTPAAEVPADPPNARLGLLRALLSIGAFKQAYWILSTYPWICEPVPEISDLLLRLLSVSISSYYYSSASPFSSKRNIAETKIESLCQQRQRYSVQDKKLVSAPSPSYAISGKPIDIPRTHAGQWREPVYFFSDWKQRIPECTTAQEVLEVLAPGLKLVGVHAARNREFFVHLLRIAKQETLPSSPRRSAWESIIRMHIIPALALSEPNPSATHEVWEILRNFSYTARFAFYGEWKDRLYKRMPELRVKRAEAERDAKGLLKRLSSDNVKQFGRSLAKIAHTNPCVLFEIALNQVQSYDNLIGPVVESARYLTPFGYDVLAYSLLDALSNPEKERTKSDGTNISLWLQGLATFAGTLCKRWNMEVAYILQYILNQLRGGNSKDLVVLRELISKMAGIEPVSDLSDSQIVALGGGTTLQAEALHPTTAAERKGVTKRSTARLKLALLDAHLAGPLLVAVAKARQECVLGLDDAPLKYLGNLFDQCQQVLFQFHDFLLSQLGAEAYSKALPPLRDLWESYGLEAGIAFHVTRPGLQLAIQNHETARMDRLREELKASRAARAEAAKTGKIAPADVDMEGAASAKGGKPANEANGSLAAEDTDVKPRKSASPSPAPNSTKAKSPWHPVLEDAVSLASRNLPEDMQVYLTPGFFVSFWQLSLYDILIPMERYQSEVDRLNGIVRELDSALRVTAPTYPGQVIDKAGEAEKRKAREKCMQTIQALNADLKAHTEAYEATRKRLQSEKIHWFMPDLGHLKQKDASSARRYVVQHLLQECLIPRARLSPIDASFSARFLRVMHNVGAVNFPSLHVYDRIFSEELPPIIFSSTEGEARNYARFLHDCLADLTAWHASESLYYKQAVGSSLPGFQRVWGAREPNEPIPESSLLTFPQFKLITTKWHKKLGEAFASCIQSKDYMCIRNCILILTKIAKFFPLFKAQGTQMEEVVAEMLVTEKREDLRVLALGYSALLKKQSPTWQASATTASQAPTKPVVSAPSTQRSSTDHKDAPSPSAEHKTVSATQATSAKFLAGSRGPAGNVSPSRASTLPSRPSSDDHRERRAAENIHPSIERTRSQDMRQPTDSTAPSPSSARTLHALPARPSLDSQRRESGLTPRSARGNASPATSRPPTPVSTRGDDDMQVVDDLVEGATREPERFARPSIPELRQSHSRPPSPKRREADSSRSTPRDSQNNVRDERRTPREEAERPARRSRAGSAESSHSSQKDKDRKDRTRTDRERGDRREREHRSERSDRDRRSDKEREKDRDSRREKERPRDREREATRERDPPRDRERDREHGREKREDTAREKERERRPRESSNRTADDKRDKEKPKDREFRTKDIDRKAVDSARNTDQSMNGTATIDANVKPAHATSSRADERPKDRGQTSDNGASRELKRSADSTTSLSDLKGPEPTGDDHESKRRRTEQPVIPSGPRAERPVPGPLSSLPSRPSDTRETSIRGRASPRDAGQGLRIKSAASVASALNSAQQHNSRLPRADRGETPTAFEPSPTAQPSQTGQSTQQQNQVDRPSQVERPSQSRDTNARPSQDLAARLGAGPAGSRNDRESSNEARDGANRRQRR